jgi:hypothetical protein
MDYMNSSKQNSDWLWEIIDNANKNSLPVRIKNLIKDKIETAKAAKRK